MTSLRHNPEVVAQRLGDEAVVVHLRTNLVYELNHSAARLWELIGEGCDLAGIEERLLLEYEVDRTQLAGEIEQMLAEFKGEDLVKVEEPPAGG